MPMLPILQVVALVLIAVGFGLSLSHALELPGKLRLSRDTYIAVQSIYYPGFTIGGVFGEFGAILAVLVTLVFTPSGSTAFLPTFAALIALLALHAIYWIVTHPVNKFWLADQKLGSAGAAFFRTASFKTGNRVGGEEDWPCLRNRWEYSHVARTCCALVAFIALAAAIAF